MSHRFGKKRNAKWMKNLKGSCKIHRNKEKTKMKRQEFFCCSTEDEDTSKEEKDSDNEPQWTHAVTERQQHLQKCSSCDNCDRTDCCCEAGWVEMNRGKIIYRSEKQRVQHPILSKSGLALCNDDPFQSGRFSGKYLTFASTEPSHKISAQADVVSPFCTEESRIQNALELLSMQPESQSGSDKMEIQESVTAVNYSVTNTLPAHCQIPSSDPGPSQRVSSCLTRSHSAPSLSPVTSTKNETLTPAQSLPNMLLKSSFEEFTPEITADENDETYRLQCSRPGLYQCSVTGLVFHMDGEGDVVYRTVPWNRRLLAQHDKQPAGPLFDIKCVQQSVCQLHLPHCETRSTAAAHFLSVAHVNDEGVEFIAPHKITETHVVINITGFSGLGNVKDGDSPPEPVRALVLLFYRPPADPDPESLLNVLLLPRNVVLRDVLHTRKKLVGDERYIETSPHCKLQPKQEYTLSTCPEDDSVLVQPTEAEFDSDNYDDYFPSFQVSLETVMKHMKLFLRDVNKRSVWERRVCLRSTGVKRSCGPSALNLQANERLLNIRSSFVDGISGPVLKSLLDKLFEKTVLSDPERELASEIQNRRDKAGFVLDTVRKKGEAASSEMMEILCEEDPFLSEHLGLI